MKWLSWWVRLVSGGSSVGAFAACTRLAVSTSDGWLYVGRYTLSKQSILLFSNTQIPRLCISPWWCSLIGCSSFCFGLLISCRHLPSGSDALPVFRRYLRVSHCFPSYTSLPVQWNCDTVLHPIPDTILSLTPCHA